MLLPCVLLPQITSILTLAFLHANAEAPPGYVKSPEAAQKNPPKYEYAYNIEDQKGTGQGKLESRDGIYALGRYYVQGSDATQSVQYYADDWGYHPLVEYSNVGPHSKSNTHLLLGVEAVKAIATNKFAPKHIPPNQHITNTIDKIHQNRQQQTSDSAVPAKQLQKNHLLLQQPSQPVAVQQSQQALIEQTQHQQFLTGQPQLQQVLVEQNKPQQIFFEQRQPQQIPQLQQTFSEQPQPQQISQPQQIFFEQHQQQQVSQPQQIFLEQTQPQQIYLDQPQPQQILTQQPPSQSQPQQITVQQQEEPQQLVLLQERQPQQNVVIQQTSEEIDGESLAQRISGSFGSRINAIERASKPSSYIVQKNVVEQSPNKLIQSTRNLVSGEDVLNINSAISASSNVETSTLRSVITTQYESSTSAQSAGSISNVQVNSEGGSGYSSTTTALPITTVTESSLIKDPIVVAEVVEEQTASSSTDVKQETKEEVYSTTANTVETVSTAGFDVTEPSTILVTPRPISTNFLAPITAGIQLQNIETSNESSEIDARNHQYLVEIQQSLPYYLGKFEYVQGTGASGYGEKSQTSIQSTQTYKTDTIQEKAVENFELGKTLLAFPEAQALVQPNAKIQETNKLLIQQLPEQEIKENFIEVDQQQAQVQQVVQQTNAPVVVEKIVETKVPYPVVQTQIVEKPVEVTRYVKQPYRVEVPVQVPVPVERHVPVPVAVEKIVEKPVPVTTIVEKPIHIPQPYPVDRIVEKQVHIPVDRIVEKHIHVPFEVTRYVDRPYAVEVPVAHPVPYPVDRVVEKIVKQPYPVEVRVPVEVKVPVEVPVAHPVPYPVDRIVEKIVKQPYPVEVRVPVEVKVPVHVEKIVEKKVHVPHYIPKPYPVDRIVEKHVPQYIDRPYAVPVKVPVPVAQPYAVPVHVTKPYVLGGVYAYPTIQQTQGQKYTTTLVSKNTHQYKQHQQQNQQLQQEQQFTYYYTPYSYAPAVKEYLPPNKGVKLNNGYLPPAQDCDQQNSHSSVNPYHTIRPDDYIGLLPPRPIAGSKNQARKFRNARSNFNSNLRLEYGFMPPLIPSQEIDEHGHPIERTEQK